MPSQPLIYDAWTAISFKRALGQRRQSGHQPGEATWVGDHGRRLTAYKVLQAYLANAARHFLVAEDEDTRDSHREYGDAALIRDTVLAALLGDDQQVVVQQADDFDPKGAGEDQTGLTDQDEARRAWEFQEWLREWWQNERGPLKVTEVERDAVGLGDGVYTLGWSPDKKRVRVRVWDPGFYFPVLDDGNEDDFPSKVHIAWEMTDPADSNKTLIRRLTWELAAIRPAVEPSLVDRVIRAEPVLQPGDRIGQTGRIERLYPYADEPSHLTCYFTDATWVKDVANPRTLDLFDLDRATFATGEDGLPVREVDLGFDFLPVIHVPNTVAIKDHFGQSTIAKVLQILDDLANSDTDAQAASATAARPVMAMSGGTLGRRAPSYRPGEVWELGEGRLDLVDTSKSLDAILKYIEFLLARLSVNARTPDALLGRVKPSEVPSGVAMAMSFGPLGTMVGEMRLSRAEKYPLMFKMIWRISLVAQAAGVDLGVPAEYHPADLQFGSFLPQDRAAAIDLVTRGLQAKAMSTETAVAVLVSAGLEIEDAAEEVRRIESRDFEGAERLQSATGSREVTFDYLHRDDPGDQPEPPVPVLGGPGDLTGLGAGEPVPGQPAVDPDAT